MHSSLFLISFPFLEYVRVEKTVFTRASKGYFSFIYLKYFMNCRFLAYYYCLLCPLLFTRLLKFFRYSSSSSSPSRPFCFSFPFELTQFILQVLRKLQLQKMLFLKIEFRNKVFAFPRKIFELSWVSPRVNVVNIGCPVTSAKSYFSMKLYCDTDLRRKSTFEYKKVSIKRVNYQTLIKWSPTIWSRILRRFPNKFQYDVIFKSTTANMVRLFKRDKDFL